MERESAPPRPRRVFALAGAAHALVAIPLAIAVAGCERGASPEGIVRIASPGMEEGAGPSLAKTGGRATLDPDDPAALPRPDGPRIGASSMNAVIYEKPDRRSNKVGYLRAGGTVARGDKPVALDDCQGGWYRVLPSGYVCAGDDATIDMKHPILRALTRRPDISKPMPYPYAFVRAIAPNYYRVPNKEEQLRYEMSLERHLRSYKKLWKKWDAIKVGANDVPLDEVGNAVGLPPDEPPELSHHELFGGNGDDSIPWFFKGGRKIPNISTFKVPGYAVITNRIARKAGLALIGTFMGEAERRLALTTDGRLVPTSKLKPARGSTFHGVDMSRGWKLPLAFVRAENAKRYDISRRALDDVGPVEYHAPVQLTGKISFVGKTRMVESISGAWLKSDDLAVAVKPSDLPWFAKGKRKWIDISILGQTLVLYEGPTPVYATAVATGRDGLGDPKKTLSTVRGTFKIRDKHVTTTMDSHEVGNQFELRDIPWVQYFEAGYALHAALWHDDFGKPRSHGCINMSPIDARRVFMWTDPPVPADWHGVSAGETTGEGTLVHIHP